MEVWNENDANLPSHEFVQYSDMYFFVIKYDKKAVVKTDFKSFTTVKCKKECMVVCGGLAVLMP